MSDDVVISGGTSIAADDVNGVKIQRVKVCWGPDGSYSDASASDPLPVDVGTVAVTGAFWQATQPVSGTFWQATQPISGTVAVSGSVAVTGTFWQATQPVSGTVTANAGTGTFAVSGPLTDTQLRATPVDVIDGAGDRASETTLQDVLTAVGSTNTKLDAIYANDTAAVTELPPVPTTATSRFTAGNVSRSGGAGETSMVTATASQTTKLYEYTVTVPGAGTVEIRDGASGTALRKHIFNQAQGLRKAFRGDPYAKTTANTALIFYWSTTGEANIDFDYIKSA